MRTAPSASATRAATSARSSPMLSGPKATSSRDRRHEQLVVGILEDEPDARAQLAQRLAPDLEPGDLEPARRRVSSPLRCSMSVVLPAPFGPEQRDALAVVDVQVDAASASRPLG